VTSDFSSRTILKFTVGIILSPIASVSITQSVIERETDIFTYLIYTILGLGGFLIGDIKATTESIEKHELKRIQIKKKRALKKSQRE
jgi:hypothetical protein